MLLSDATELLSLPEVLLREVLCWICDIKSANAFLGTCSVLSRLRHDPDAAALLLLRCACKDEASITACTRGWGLPLCSLLKQLLQRVKATPAATPPALLQAMLYSAATQGDAAAIQALLRLPQPPDVNADSDTALRNTLMHGPHDGTVQALLDGGADLFRSPVMPLIYFAAETPCRLDALRLFLQRCPPHAHAEAIRKAMWIAVRSRNAAAVAFLLPVLSARGEHPAGDSLPAAVHSGGVEVLRLLLEACPTNVDKRTSYLRTAVRFGHITCAELLLDLGADVHREVVGDLAVDRELVEMEDSLDLAVDMSLLNGAAAAGLPPIKVRHDVVRLLLLRGAVVKARTLARADSPQGGCPQMSALLRRAAGMPSLPAQHWSAVAKDTKACLSKLAEAWHRDASDFRRYHCV